MLNWFKREAYYKNVIKFTQPRQTFGYFISVGNVNKIRHIKVSICLGDEGISEVSHGL